MSIEHKDKWIIYFVLILITVVSVASFVKYYTYSDIKYYTSEQEMPDIFNIHTYLDKNI